MVVRIALHRWRRKRVTVDTVPFYRPNAKGTPCVPDYPSGPKSSRMLNVTGCNQRDAPSIDYVKSQYAHLARGYRGLTELLRDRLGNNANRLAYYDRSGLIGMVFIAGSPCFNLKIR